MKNISIIILISVTIAGCFFSEEKSLRNGLSLEASILKLPECKFSSIEEKQLLVENPALEDYLAFAAINNPALRKSYYLWQAAVEKIPQARSLPDPKFSYSHYVREVETRVGPQKNKFSLMQMVPWPSKIINRTDKEIRNALSAKYLYDAEKLKLFYKVRKAYAEYYYLSRSIAIMQDNMILLKNLEESLRTRYTADSASNSALIRLQVELGKLEDRIKSLYALRSPVSSNLNIAMGRISAEVLPFPEKLTEKSPTLNEAELLAAIADDNPGLRSAREKVLKAKSLERLAHAQYLPDFSIGAGFIETDRRTDVNVNDNGKDPVLLMAEMSLPVWWSKNSAGVREAEASRKAEEAELEHYSNQLTNELKMSFYKYNDAGRKHSLFANTLIPKAEQALYASRSSFIADRSSFADLIDAERNLLEIRLLSERAVVDRSITLAQLEMLCGKELRSAAQ